MKKTLGSIAIVLMFLCWNAPASAADFGGVEIHGFASQGYLISDEYNYLAHNSKEGSFDYNEMGINFGKQVTDKLRIGVQFFSRDLGDIANNKITLDYAYGDYHWRDYLGIRAGRIKQPIGLYNETRDIDMLRTAIVQPQGIYNDLLRDAAIALNGVGLYGNVPLGVIGSLDYQVMTGTVNVDLDSGIGKYGDSALGTGEITKNTSDENYIGSLRWETPLAGLRLGGTYSKNFTDAEMLMSVPTTAPFPFDTADIEIEGTSKSYTYVISAEYTWNDLVLAVEYYRQKIDSAFAGHSETMEGESYYVSASYRFNSWFTLGAYYSEYFPDRNDKDGDELAIDHRAWQKDLALTLRFDINDYMVFKIEGHSVNGTADVLDVDNQDSDFSEKEWYYGAAKLSFGF